MLVTRPSTAVDTAAGSARPSVTGYAVCGNGAALYDIGADRLLQVHELSAVQLMDIVRALDAGAAGHAALAAERIAVGDPAAGGDVVQFVTETGTPTRGATGRTTTGRAPR